MQALRVESAVSATAIGHALGHAAPIRVDEPVEIQHFAKWNPTKIEIEARDKHIVAGIEQVLGKQEKVVDELTFVDRDAFDALPDPAFEVVDGGKDFPRIAGIEFEGLHLCVTHWIAALDNTGPAFCIVARLEDEHVLPGIFATHFRAAQQFGRLVAAHGTQQ
jgi:hypothetical protein